jgi:hypothetical protein
MVQSQSFNGYIVLYFILYSFFSLFPAFGEKMWQIQFYCYAAVLLEFVPRFIFGFHLTQHKTITQSTHTLLHWKSQITW